MSWRARIGVLAVIGAWVLPGCDAGASAPRRIDEPRPSGPSVADVVAHGPAAAPQRARPTYGGLVVAEDGERVYVVESRRDVEPGPFERPWRCRFRLAAYDLGVEAWSFAAEPDDLIGDVVVHPSGDVTLTIERAAPARAAYELVRLARSGEVRAQTNLAVPRTIPAEDYGASGLPSLLRMKSVSPDATAAGWVRLLSDGEGVVAAFLTLIEQTPVYPSDQWLALGIEALDWSAHGYVERWARVVDGPHGASPAAWAYDELRWREQAVRPFLTRDAVSREILVGRAWNIMRCLANARASAEFTEADCSYRDSPPPFEIERLPLAVTRFAADGERLATRVLRVDDSAAEQMPFALAARAGELAVVGAIVRMLPDGRPASYPDAGGFVNYDGYVKIYDARGNQLRQHDWDLGRGDVLTAIRWTDQGIVAVGSSGWDRWQGGMSISRGASPLLVWFSADGADARERVLPLGQHERHWTLHDVSVSGSSIVAVGFSDGPMTHSGDGGFAAGLTFGGLQVHLTP